MTLRHSDKFGLQKYPTPATTCMRIGMFGSVGGDGDANP